MSEQSPARDAADSASGATDALPEDGATPTADGAPRVVGLDSTDADDVIGAVASETARTVLAALSEEPSTASGLADRVDLTLQTVQYHLGNLEDAGLVEVVDTAASEKGQQMDVYGPARRPVVVYAGDDDGDDLRTVLKRLVSGVAFLGLVSLLVQEVLAPKPTAYEGGRAEDVAVSMDAPAGAAGAAGVEPGLVFFAGGLAVLVAYLAVWYLRRRGALDGVLAGA